jgi:hypothetical protein
MAGLTLTSGVGVVCGSGFLECCVAGSYFCRLSHEVGPLCACSIDRLLYRFTDRVRLAMIERLNLDCHTRCRSHRSCKIAASDLFRPYHSLKSIFRLGAGAARFPADPAKCRDHSSNALRPPVPRFGVGQACSCGILLPDRSQRSVVGLLHLIDHDPVSVIGREIR